MIDGLVSQCGQRLIDLWKRDEGGTGLYPPPSLHVSEDYKMCCFLKKDNASGVLNCFCFFSQALLDIYLLENVEESAKHAIASFLSILIYCAYTSILL